MSEKPIGIFDSGVGGLTVYREVCRLLPLEEVIYLGDTARVPYGTKSADVVLKYALQDSLFLMDLGVKLIVIACNTATACALPYLRERLRVPVIGVIEPGAQAALAMSKGRRVGIIATEGTIRSGAYEKALRAIDASVQCFGCATPLLVPLVEENIVQPAIIDPILRHYLSDMKKFDPDSLILGCTHYPILADSIGGFMGSGVTLVDSATTTAREVASVLMREGLISSGRTAPPSRKIFVTDAPERVRAIAERILGVEHSAIELAEV